MKTTKLTILFLVGTIILFNAYPTFAQTPAGPTGPVEIESFFNSLFDQQMKDYHLAGIMAVMVKDGRVAFQKGYGYSDIEKQTPVDPSTTLFRIGSVSKLFVWTAVLQLYEQGKLDLDADINKYLDFQIPDTFPEPITLKHLMSHTAGFEQNAYQALALAPDQIQPLGQFLANHIPARVYPPGQVSVYSDYGTDLAGHIVERVAGVPYADYVKTNILKPLGMDYTILSQPPAPPLAGSLSNGYQYTQNGLQPANFELMNTVPSGAMSTSAADMAQFMLAHLQSGSLCPNDRGNTNPPCGSILQAGTEQLVQSSLWKPQPSEAGYTYGFMELHYNGQRILHHGGDTAGFHSLLMLLPDQNLGFFVSYNTTSPGFGFEQTLLAVMDHYYPANPSEDPPAAGSASGVENYTGGYRPIRSTYTTLEKANELMNWVEFTNSGDGTLLASVPLSSQTTRLEEIEPLLFREVTTGSKALFQKDSLGRIAYLYDSISIYPFATYVKAPWHANPLLHLGLLIVCTSILLSVLLAGFVSGIVRLVKRGGRSVQPTTARFARLFALLVALLDVLALIGFLLITLFSNQFILMITYGQMSTINLILAAWLLAAVLTIVLAAMTVLVWMRGFWGHIARIHYTLVTLAALAFIWFLNYWNLLGFRY